MNYVRLIFITCFLLLFSGLKSQINFDSLWSVWNHTTQSVKDKDMQSQKTLFKKEFEPWKDTLDQVDDVCIMGVRIT